MRGQGILKAILTKRCDERARYTEGHLPKGVMRGQCILKAIFTKGCDERARYTEGHTYQKV